jgi:hypothetical protein
MIESNKHCHFQVPESYRAELTKNNILTSPEEDSLLRATHTVFFARRTHRVSGEEDILIKRPKQLYPHRQYKARQSNLLKI